MQTYIGVKMIEAEPCPAWKDSGKHKKGDPGYKVRYPDGYESWSPKDVFEAAYFPLEKSDSISEEDVMSFIDRDSEEIRKMGEKTTALKVDAITGFSFLEGSACVDPANYSEEVGSRICRNSVAEKVWEHLGFVLQWAKNGLCRG
mgnify:CR=1 FL=1